MSDSIASDEKVLCIGEILWDALPDGLYLGGAPLNVCYHLNQLGIIAAMCSKIGTDRLGKEALRRIKQKRISTKYIQSDDEAETGFVEVEIAPNGEPTYDIIKPVAWDFIESTASLAKAVQKSWGFVFGTLAQRNEQSRHTIRQLWQYDCKKILDLNLRPPYISQDVVRDSLQVADIVKMNAEELLQLKKWFSLSGDKREMAERLAEQYHCSMICITQGPDGAMLYQNGAWFEHKGYRAEAKDSVGAGDAFLAALIYGIQKNQRGEDLLRYANAAGSLVAQKSGATPEYQIQDIRKLAKDYSMEENV